MTFLGIQKLLRHTRTGLDDLGLRYSEQRIGKGSPSIIWNVERIR